MPEAPHVRLRNPPIVEAVVDIDCDLPPAFDLIALEKVARRELASRYPRSRSRLTQEHIIPVGADGSSNVSTRPVIEGLLFLQEDEKQLIQIRTQGFSFNRLAPYATLDDYLAEIERTWRIYVDVASPIQIRSIRLRYINRILLPLPGGKVDLDAFLKIGPRLPDEEHLVTTGFFTQQTALEKATGCQINLVLTSQAPENEKLPVILDIGVASATIIEPTDWSSIVRSIQSLRGLKNSIFLNTLTTKCLDLFQ